MTIDKATLTRHIIQERGMLRNSPKNNDGLQRLGFHKSNDEIMGALSGIKELMSKHFGEHFEKSIEEQYSNFWKEALPYAQEFTGEKETNMQLLDHVKIMIIALNEVETMVKACGRFSDEEIAAVKQQTFLHDVGRLISQHPVLHQQFEEYRGLPNHTADGKKVESDYTDFDIGEAKKLTTISALFSFIDTFTKPDTKLGVRNPLDFFGITDETKKLNIIDTLPSIIESKPRAGKEKIVKPHREDKLKTSLLLVLKDLVKNFPEFNIQTRADLEEKIVKPIGTKAQNTITKEFFKLED